MKLYLNIGNTHTELSTGPDAEIDIVRSANLVDFLSSKEEFVEEILIVSVVPQISSELKLIFGQRLRVLTIDSVPEIDFSLVDGSSLGADRIANALAAKQLYGAPVMIIDCGTCITTELLTKGNQFSGGATLPGRQLQRKILHEATGQLPLISLAHSLPKVNGLNTHDAISAGIDLGLCGALEKLINTNRAAIPKLKVVFTGGDAPFFLENFPEYTQAPKNFTLSALFLITQL